MMSTIDHVRRPAIWQSPMWKLAPVVGSVMIGLVSLVSLDSLQAKAVLLVLQAVALILGIAVGVSKSKAFRR